MASASSVSGNDVNNRTQPRRKQLLIVSTGFFVSILNLPKKNSCIRKLFGASV
jgi:hypothetical protein